MEKDNGGANAESTIRTLAEWAKIEGLPSVQALRKRVQSGSIESVKVRRGVRDVTAVTAAEMVRHYTLPDGNENNAEQPFTAPESPSGAYQNSEQPIGSPATEDAALTTVDALTQGWADSRERLVEAHKAHLREVQRLESALEQVGSALKGATTAQEVAAKRSVRSLGTAAALVVGALGAAGWALKVAGEASTSAQAQSDRAQREEIRAEAAERKEEQADIQRQLVEKTLLEAQMTLGEAQAQAQAAARAQQEAEKEAQELLEERQRAVEATKAALRAMRG
jgi:hypothetical protein